MGNVILEVKDLKVSFYKRRREGLTTPKQIRCLERFGFSHVGTWPFDAASNMISRIAAQGWRGVPRGVDPATYDPTTMEV